MSDVIKVLLVEDEVLQAKLIKSYLEPDDFFVVTHCQDLKEAMVAVQDRPDVVLLDLNLPESQGANTFIAFMELSLDVPVIVLTNIDDTELVLQAVASGVYNWLLKTSVTAEGLKLEIKKALHRKRIQMRAARLSDEQRQINQELSELVKLSWSKILAHLGNLIDTVSHTKATQPEKDALTREITAVMELASQVLTRMQEELDPGETPAEHYKLVSRLIRDFSQEDLA